MKTLFLLSALIVLASCNSPQHSTDEALAAKVTNEPFNSEHPGKALMQQYCYACHNASTPEADRIAPPMIAIKRHYISEDTTREEFTTELLEWVKEPSEAKAKMFGAVNRFGVMPYQTFPVEDIKLISEYIFDYEIEQPDWFEAHFQQGHGKGMGKGMRRGNGSRN